MKSSMLKPVRIAAGLGNPPQPFYTNDVKSHNNVIKQHTKYTAQELPQFVEKMKSLIASQKEEIERAVVGMGEYRLAHTFKNLTVDTRKCQRKKVLKQVFSATFEDQKRKCVSDEMEANDTRTISKADKENPLCQLSIPHYVAEKVWKEGNHRIAVYVLLLVALMEALGW